MINERYDLLDKTERTPEEEQRLRELDEELDNLPTGSHEDNEAMEIIRKAAALIKERNSAGAMIRIDKPPKPPNVLLNRGVKQTKKDKAAYDNDPDGYRSGNQKFQFKNTIYGHESVKQVLLNAQHRQMLLL